MRTAAILGTDLYIGCFITLTPVAPPAEGLQIFFGRQTAFGNWYNVINLQQQVRFCYGGGPTVFASEVIALLDVLAQFAGHKCSLPGHSFAELDLFGQIDDKAI